MKDNYRRVSAIVFPRRPAGWSVRQNGADGSYYVPLHKGEFRSSGIRVPILDTRGEPCGEAMPHRSGAFIGQVWSGTEAETLVKDGIVRRFLYHLADVTEAGRLEADELKSLWTIKGHKASNFDTKAADSFGELPFICGTIAALQLQTLSAIHADRFYVSESRPGGSPVEVKDALADEYTSYLQKSRNAALRAIFEDFNDIEDKLFDLRSTEHPF